MGLVSAWASTGWWARGDADRAVALGQRALAIAAELGDQELETIARHLLGFVHLGLGDHARASDLLRGNMALPSRASFQRPAPTPKMPSGPPRTSTIRSEALPLLDRILSEDALVNLYHALCVVHLGEAYVRLGRMEDARDVARRALDGAHPPEVASAEAFYRQALARAAELGMRPLAAQCHLGLARLDCQMGEGRASSHLATARGLFREMGMPEGTDGAALAAPGRRPATT